MSKQEFIKDMERKLASNKKLNAVEIQAIIAALRETNNYPQTPYYEVIYHDEYDNKERRIMEPVYSRTFNSGVPGCEYCIQEDHFDLNFRRIIPKEVKDVKVSN